MSLIAGGTGITLMLRRNINGYRQEIELLDGGSVTLRFVCPDDKNALRSFHSRLSEDTRFLRYQYSKAELTESDLEDFCNIDYCDTLTLVAEAGLNGQKSIVGMGQYYRLNDPKTAEVAFVVQDNEQGKGIGTQLVKHLALLAWQENIRVFVAEVLRMNVKMLSIFSKSDPEMEQVVGGGSSCTVTFRVSEAMSQRLLKAISNRNKKA